jgi:hypothetical protein
MQNGASFEIGSGGIMRGINTSAITGNVGAFLVTNNTVTDCRT